MKMHEARHAAAIVAAALAKAYSLSVDDGEAIPISHSTDPAALLAALGSTDEDRILLYHADRRRAGCILLVYGNEPGVLIADYSDNEATNAVVLAADKLMPPTWAADPDHDADHNQATPADLASLAANTTATPPTNKKPALVWPFPKAAR